MYRTFVILRHTFREAVVQPIYTLLVALGAAVLVIFSMLPFFTFGEDTVMYMSVGLDVVLLAVLISTLFATSHSIYEEIEDRTMLTLMSKPLKKWEVIVGKYLGIVAAALLAVGILGAIMVLCVWWRVPNDYLLQADSLDDRILKQIADYRYKHIAGLLPSLILVWLQISVLAAIGVALSTRFSLVVNLPTVILLYIAGNLTRFLFPLEGRSLPVRILGYVAGAVLPFLQTFDLRPITLFRDIRVPGTIYAADPHAVGLGTIWGYIAVATLYGIAYATFALGSGLLLFQSRELGGAEG